METEYIYIACWSGGYDPPSYQAFSIYDNAVNVAKEWAEDMEEGVDTIDVISINLETLEVKRLYDI